MAYVTTASQDEFEALRAGSELNPPSAPHFGGAWESLVKSTKRTLVAILNQQAETDEILVTALTIVGNVLNDRLLTSDDPEEPEMITPNHLLTGRANPNSQADMFNDSELNYRKRWRFAEALASWLRWMQEDLPTTAGRKRWYGKQSNLCVGGLVTILHATTPRSRWPLGRITKVVPDKDGTVRSAFIKIGDTELQRPAVKICPIPKSD